MSLKKKFFFENECAVTTDHNDIVNQLSINRVLSIDIHESCE
jgi:hypothetical protein